MSEKKRKQYTEEYKREAVGLVREQGYKITEAARNLGIDIGMLGRWVRQYNQGEEGALSDRGRMNPQEEEIARLRKDNKRLRMEREILKKAAAFFVKEAN